MSDSIPLDKAELLGTLLEGILYGFSIFMFGGTIWQLRSTRYENRIMLSVACLMFVSSTLHMVIDIIRIMDALILYRDTYPGGPIAFLANVSQWTYVSKNYVYTIQTMLGDFVILYRCYVVWQSKYVMIVPVAIWLAAGVTGFGTAVVASQSSIFDGVIMGWGMSFYATSFVANVLATLLLSWRIWCMDRQATRIRAHQKSLLRPLLYIILDAGLIYTLALLAGWICFLFQSYGHFVVHNMMVPINSIAFYMVIICVGLVYRPRSQLFESYTDSHPSTNKI